MHSAYVMPELPGFMQTQYAFAAHLRDPERSAAPSDVTPERMAVYRELIYNNVEDFLSSAFPVLRRISSDSRWHAMVRDFFVRHRATTPFFPQLPQEFLLYLEQVREPCRDDFPFLLELAHYEWAELALSISDAQIDKSHIIADGSLLNGEPVLSPLIWHCRYRFPVHRISMDYLPEQAPDNATHLAVYRDCDDEVGFLELNPVAAQLLERLQHNNGQNGEQILRELATAIQHPNPETVIRAGGEILEDLRQRAIVLGTRG